MRAADDVGHSTLNENPVCAKEIGHGKPIDTV